MAELSLPLGFLEDKGPLASEEEIALANINMRKEADEEKRKARKTVQEQRCLVAQGDVVSSGIAQEEKAKTSSKKAKQTRKAKPKK